MRPTRGMLVRNDLDRNESRIARFSEKEARRERERERVGDDIWKRTHCSCRSQIANRKRSDFKSENPRRQRYIYRTEIASKSVEKKVDIAE